MGRLFGGVVSRRRHLDRGECASSVAASMGCCCGTSTRRGSKASSVDFSRSCRRSSHRLIYLRTRRSGRDRSPSLRISLRRAARGVHPEDRDQPAMGSDTVCRASRDWSTFWERFARICDRLVDRFQGKEGRGPHLGPRPSVCARRVIRDFLNDNGFPWPPTSDLQLSSAELSRYAGTYTRKIGDRTAEVEIRVVDGDLTIVGPRAIPLGRGRTTDPEGGGRIRGGILADRCSLSRRARERSPSFRLVTISGGRATDESVCSPTQSGLTCPAEAVRRSIRSRNWVCGALRLS